MISGGAHAPPVFTYIFFVKKFIISLLITLLSFSIYSSPMCSAGIKATAGYSSMDDISSFRYSLGLSVEPGYDITPSLALYGSLDLFSSFNLYSLNRFLSIPFVFSLGVGAGVLWRLPSSFFLKVGAGATYSAIINNDKYIDGFATVSIGYTLTKLKNEPIAYSISVPFITRFGKDSLSFEAGIVLSMDVSAVIKEGL